MKSPIKAVEQTWVDPLDTGKAVRVLKSRRLFCYVANNETPPVVNICISGPDDRGVTKDVYIDVESLLKELVRLKVK